jgi:hypothetical protein
MTDQNKVIVNYSKDLTVNDVTHTSTIQNNVKYDGPYIRTIQPLNINNVSNITNNPSNISAIIALSSNTSSNIVSLSPQDILGPFYRGQDMTIVNQIQQILNRLTLPELFNILNQYGININDWKNANIRVDGNRIILSYTYSSPLTSVFNNQVVGQINKEYTMEIENINGWVVVRYTERQSGTYMGNPITPTVKNAYYVVNPITKEIIETRSTDAIPTIVSGYIVKPNEVINEYLKPYGYKIPDEYISQINNLQPGQSIVVNARAYNYDTNTWGSVGAQFRITYLGGDQYKIESVDQFYNFYNFNQPWTSLDVTITLPKYTYNMETNKVTTTDLKIYGTVTTSGATSLNLPYLETTYNVNQTIPILSKIQNDQITFQTGTPQTNITLQNINLPILTKEQYQQLQGGNVIENLKPGWYYYPETGEIIRLEYETVTQPQINWDKLWFGYLPLPENKLWGSYSSQSTNKTTLPTIYMFGLPINEKILNKIIKNIENWHNSPANIPPKELENSYLGYIKNSLPGTTVNYLNYQWFNYSTPLPNILSSNVVGVLGPSVNLSPDQIRNNELENIIFEMENIKEYVNRNKAYGGFTWLGIHTFANLAEIFAKTGLKQPAEFFAQITRESLISGTPANVGANILGMVDVFGLLSLYSIPNKAFTIKNIEKVTLESPKLLTQELKLYTTSANIGKTLPTFDVTTTTTTQSFKAINPILIREETGLLTNVKNIGVSESFAKTLISNAMSGIRSDVKGYLKDVAIWTGINWAGGNIVSLAVGQPITTVEGQLKLLGESAAAGVTFATLGRVFASTAKPILSLWTKPDESLNWAIRKRMIYDVGTGFITGVSASYAAQGAGILMGSRNEISHTEALLSGGFIAGTTALIRGIQGLRAVKTGDFHVFATDTVPYNVKTTDISSTILGDEKGTILYKSTNIAWYSPRIGKRIITEKDVPNLKLKEMEFQTKGIIKMKDDIGIAKIENLNIPTYEYAAYLVSRAGKNEVYGISEGIFFGIRKPIQAENPFNYYLGQIEKIRTHLIKKYPEFEKIKNTPETGMYLFKTLTEGTYEQTVKGVNMGKTLLQANIDAYLEKKLYEETILKAQNKIKELKLSPNEAKWELEMAKQYYNEGLEILKKYKANIENALKNDIKSLTNKPEFLEFLKGLGNYIPPEKFNINPGKLPNPEGLNIKILEKINIKSNKGLIFKKPNIEMSYKDDLLSEFKINNVDFSKNIANEFQFMVFSKAKISTGDIYKSTYYGHGVEYEGSGKYISHIGTVYGIEKDATGKGFYTIKQYGGIKLSENRYLGFGYGESWDPTIKSMSLPSLRNVKGQPLSKIEAQQLLSNTIRPPVPYESNIKPSLYGMSINMGNIYNNINMGQPSPYGNNKQIGDIRNKIKPITNEIIRIDDIQTIKQPSIKIFQSPGLSSDMKIDVDIKKDVYLQTTNLFGFKVGNITLTSTMTIPTTRFRQTFPIPPTPPPPKPPITGFMPLFSLRLQPGSGSAPPPLNRNVKVMYDLYYALKRLR